jgi:hypothetical protein
MLRGEHTQGRNRERKETQNLKVFDVSYYSNLKMTEATMGR